ncbi:MAG: baseplate assembly protein [Pontibacterium sp.]
MSTAFTAIDLSQLPAPDVVEQLDYEDILSEMITDLQGRDASYSALVESDPAYKILEVAAYRELLIRQRVNDASRAVMLAYAEDGDLDHIGANFRVYRRLITPGDPDAVPPVGAVYESNEEFRRRIQLSPEGYTTAGSSGGYEFHALGADAGVLDAKAVTPAEGQVTVYVLSRDGDGSASAELLAAVDQALSAETVRPMTDLLTVQSASVVSYTVDAVLTVFPGPDSEVVRGLAETAVTHYVSQQQRIGRDVNLSGLYSALHQAGVQNVDLVSPSGSLVVGVGEVAYCSGVTVTVGGADV